MPAGPAHGIVASRPAPQGTHATAADVRPICCCAAYRRRRRDHSTSTGSAHEYQRTQDEDLRELVEIGGDLDVDDASEMRRDELVERILQRQVERGGQSYATGILDIVDEGYGFLRRHGLMPGPEDIYVSSTQVRKFGLRTGDRVGGVTRSPKDGEKYWGLLRVESVNGVDPDTARRRPHFDVLTPIHPSS